MATSIEESASRSLLDGWRIVRRFALTIYLLIPLLACFGFYAGILPKGPLFNQPYFLTVLIIVLFTVIATTLWQIDRIEASSQEVYTPLQQFNLVRYYTFIGGLLALVGIGITVVLMGQVTLKYLLGGVCAVFGVLAWLAGYSRKQQLQQAPTGKMFCGLEGISLESAVHQYKPYYLYSRNVMLLSYCFSAIGVIAFYLLSEGQYFSGWDLGGVLFLLISSGYWDYRIGKQVEASMREENGA